ncbi:hypothetical protein P3102_22500 [Amycolatopsis sp. QT-25]|uniref:zinc finger domain-containing protein n=1 Tax=Amycolatopsis sp. QT-25 TaxID=3034022 RepID=UPI0023EB842E|nr:hypothetical protein [Amycolatopsis sp. QT-25]WET76877.1 hypothetical protein P3102_22500 [Amycolatopsis sp. QT-25]
MGTIYAVMSRSDVRGLLTRHTDTHVTDDLVTAWLSGLAGYSLTECHAAMSAMGTSARRATPSDVAGSCDAARDRSAEQAPSGPAAASTAIPPQRGERPATERDYHRQAGMRGIRTAYEVMGWRRNPEHDLARSVECPFCKAKAWVVCGPLSRNRAGVRELRDKTTRMHPSRLEFARAQLARQAVSTPQAEKETAR